ncbi:hypothetical protein BaRGS_00004480 [Batillaria attramentaria]|uniref:C1q domain-containing protein n=1 Tax=Batillaria attramentaria TaxID=370345 RepID=A0ABD0LXF9_9CAEN
MDTVFNERQKPKGKQTNNKKVIIIIKRKETIPSLFKLFYSVSVDGCLLSVAFTVRFSMDPVQNVGEHGILMFDSIVYNLGDGYDPSTGTFTAPLPGIYVFFISIMGSDNQPAIRVDITQESGKVLDAAWAEGQGDLYDQGSSLVTTHLTAGERVWVKHDGGATALRGGVYTVFSGFLVQADQ